ncbi:hypothetical protein [Candidatus Accumulibacter contiguus]|uniref:hypothetical protein n=1 Tax=Candidatus Accumulibacter contiguus TaxID=2954381 RepID=UPI002BB0E1C2|nr:hypothetical protein [Candidatus Accumulibacter phosphatis]
MRSRVCAEQRRGNRYAVHRFEETLADFDQGNLVGDLARAAVDHPPTWSFRASQPIETRSSTVARRPTWGVCTQAPACHAAGKVHPGAYGRIVRLKMTEQVKRQSHGVHLLCR